MADGRGWREWDGRAGGAGSVAHLPCAPGNGIEWDGMGWKERGEGAAGTGWPFAVSTCPPAHIAALADACRAPCIPCFCPSLWQTAPQSRMLPAAIRTEPCMAAAPLPDAAHRVAAAPARPFGIVRPRLRHGGTPGGATARPAPCSEGRHLPDLGMPWPAHRRGARPGRRRYLHGALGHRCGPRRRCMGTMFITPGGAVLPGWKKRTMPPTASGSGSWRRS